MPEIIMTATVILPPITTIQSLIIYSMKGYNHCPIHADCYYIPSTTHYFGLLAIIMTVTVILPSITIFQSPIISTN